MKLSFPISKELDEAIDIFLKYINETDGMSEDCYRDEIDFWLKDNQPKLTEQQYRQLKDYYVLGGIFEANGSDH